MVKTKAQALAAATALLIAAALLASGCGSTKSYANNPRPAATLTLTAAVANRHIVVSPASFGAGPVQVVVANETGASQQIALQRDDGGLIQRIGPINPMDTASFKANLVRGRYTLRSSAAGIRPARLMVGAARPTAQNRLLLP